MISIADGHDPRGDDPRDRAAPAASVESNAASTVRTALGPAQDAERDLGRDPERPLGADERAEQVGPRRLARDAAEPDELAVRAARRRGPVTWLTVKPYFRQCAPPEFSATLPPIVQTCWLDGSGA